MALANLIGKGLEKADTDAAEVARYLEKIGRKLEDAKRSSNHLDTRFDIAFDPSQQEVKAVTEAVERLRGELTAWIKKHRPELLKK